jgi:hypothetical protein
MFVDETGFSLRATTGSTWAPRGQTPILRRVSTRRALSTVNGVTLSGRIDTRHFERAACGYDIAMPLCHFQQHVPGPLNILITTWHRPNAHRITVLQEDLGANPAIEVHWPPLCTTRRGAMAM